MQSHRHLPNGHVASYHDNAVHGEDAFLIRELDEGSVLDAVLDGATGHGGKYASEFVADTLQAAQFHTLHELITILETANASLFSRGKGSFLLTTLSVALKIGETLHLVNVGDSPGYLIRAGDIVGLTTATGDPTFFGIANALGRRARLSYTARELTLQPRDRLVLVTDGILDNIAPAELVALVQGAASPEEAITRVQDLLEARKRTNRGRRDDYSGFRSDDATAIIRFMDEGAVTSD